MNASEKIRSWIDRYYPKTVVLRPGDDRVLVSVYNYMQTPSAELSEAVGRIQAQMPYWPDGHAQEYLVYEADKKALSMMCNDYCMILAGAYELYPSWAKLLAEKNYKRCTELFIQLQK
jgi:hypothetical protein